MTNLSLPTEQTIVTATLIVAYGNDLPLVEAQTLELAAGVTNDLAPGAPAPAVR